MSADACVVFFGLCYELAEHELEALELRSDARLRAAREAKLEHYWANFAAPDERYLLLIGTQIGVFGPENRLEAVVDRLDLETIMAATVERLQQAGLPGAAKLHVQWYADA